VRTRLILDMICETNRRKRGNGYSTMRENHNRPASADILAKVARVIIQPISLAPGSLVLCSSHRVLIHRASSRLTANLASAKGLVCGDSDALANGFISDDNSRKIAARQTFLLLAGLRTGFHFPARTWRPRVPSPRKASTEYRTIHRHS
jgi:hypothetical protein